MKSDMRRSILFAPLMAASLLFFACSNFTFSKIDMSSFEPGTNLGTLLSGESTIGTLSAVSQLSVSSVYNNQIALGWNSVEGARSYRVERAVVRNANENGEWLPSDSDFKVLKKNVYGTSFVDGGIISNPLPTSPEYGYRYFYRVCAQNFQLCYGTSDFYPDFEEENLTAGAQFMYGHLFSCPRDVEAEKGVSTEYIEIKWDAVSGASDYEIYRSKSESENPVLIDSVRGNTTSYKNRITDKSELGTEFYYRIKAVNAKGGNSIFSSPAIGYSAREGAPAAPSVKAEKEIITEPKVSLSWNVSTATRAGASYSVSYAVFRNSSKDSSYMKLATLKDKTSFTDEKNIVPDVCYYYYIQAIAVNDSDETDVLKSSFSSEPAKVFMLSAPANLMVTDSENPGKVILKWNAAVGSDSEKYGNNFTYRIYSRESADSLPSVLQENIENKFDDSDIVSAEVEKKNFYSVSTCYAGNESAESELAAPVPEAVCNIKVSRCAGERTVNSMVSAKGYGNVIEFRPNENNVYPTVVTWDDAEGVEPGSYNVYRSTKKISGYKKINDEPLRTKCFVDSDSSLKSGIAYYYRVIPLNSLGRGSKIHSETPWGYGAVTPDQWFREYNKTVMSSQKKLTLMHKKVDTDKLGSESKNGTFSGSLSYNAKIAGLGAKIIMHYENYCDFHIAEIDETIDMFNLTGNTDTESDMSGNGRMSGIVNCSGMYPGTADYNGLEIKNKNAGGGYYGVSIRDASSGEVILRANVDWKVGEEGK